MIRATIRPRSNTRRTLRLDPLEPRTVPANFTVTTTLDDGTSGSLRWAINQVNADTDPSSIINFDISGLGVQTISLTSYLPAITHPVVVNGYSQGRGAHENTQAANDDAVLRIALDGSALSDGPGGLVIQGGNSTVQGLVVSNFPSSGIVLESDGNVVRGDFVGTDATGTVAAGNGGTATPAYSFDGGVAVDGFNNRIGGSVPSDRNLISGNHAEGIWLYHGGNNTVAGNFIGTDVTGTTALGNDSDGIGVVQTGYGQPGPTQGNTIGGTDAGSRNIISGNRGVRYLDQNGAAGSGIYLAVANDTVIEGNFIGTDVTGTQALGIQTGISVSFSTHVTVGGTAPGAGNLVSGNQGYGIVIGASDGGVIQGNKIGTTATGTVALPNGGGGVRLFSGNNLVGGTTPGTRNVISDGVVLQTSSSVGNVVEGNLIGTDPTGTGPVRDAAGHIATTSAGVYIFQGAHDNQIGGTGPGGANVIGFHQVGVAVQSDGSTGNSIRGNAIFEDAIAGVALEESGNNLLGAPAINAVTSAGGSTIVSGTLQAAANTVYNLDFYGTLDYGGVSDGERYVGSGTVTTGGDGSGSFAVSLTPGLQLDEALTATATDPAGNTSAFSATFVTGHGPARTFPVTNTSDFGPGSLRQAIFDANRNGGNSTITFAIPTTDPGFDPQSGRFTIRPQIALPRVASPVVINGYTQPGSSANSQAIGDNAVRNVVIDGSLDPGGQNGLHLTAGSSTVRGLTISNFSNGIWLDSNGGGTVAGNELTDCSIGVNAGEFVNDNNPHLAVSANDDTIGGAALADRNLIAASGAGIFLAGNSNRVEGNYLGVDASGSHATDFSGWAQVLIEGSGNSIGGPAAGAGNVINGTISVAPFGFQIADTLIQGNLIGTDATGQAALLDPPTASTRFQAGISLANDDHTVILGNVISGNWRGIDGYGGPNAPIIQGNLIGTDKSGTRPIPNAGDGINVDAQIGGPVAGEGNVIAFNGGNGVILGADGDHVEGNSIHDNGGAGVKVWDDPITSAAITDNTISNNGGPGVWVLGSSLDFDWAQVYGGGPYIPVGVEIQRNSIAHNGGLGIDLGAIPLGGTGQPTNDVTQWDGLSDNPDGVPQNGSPVGINHGQKFPVLSAAWTGPNLGVSGTFDGTANTTFTLDFYANTQADPSGYGEGETYLGETTVTTDVSGHAVLNLALPFTAAAGQWLSVTATDPTGDTSEFSQDVQVQTYAQYLQSILPQSNSSPNALTITAGQSSTPAVVIDAVNRLTNVIQPVTITLDLAGQTWTTDVSADPPPNVTLVIQDGTLVGGSPAITVSGGAVIVRNCTLTNATDAPTVLVTGGSLTLRDDVIQESTAYSDAGIKVTGGTVDLGTTADPGNDTVTVNGPGSLIQNSTADPVTALGDTWEQDGSMLASPYALVSGRVAWQVRVAPTITVTGGSFAYDEHAHPATGSVTGVNGEPLGTPTFTYSFTDDNGNVITSAAPPSDPGNYSVTAAYAGNDNYLPATATTTITIYYDVRTLSDLSKAFNAGRTIPIKIQFTDAAGNNISSPDISVLAVALYRVNADGSRSQVSLQDAGGSNPNDLFRYDPSIGGYIFNLSTKGLGAGTYAFDWMAGDDPTTHELGFKLV